MLKRRETKRWGVAPGNMGHWAGFSEAVVGKRRQDLPIQQSSSRNAGAIRTDDQSAGTSVLVSDSADDEEPAEMSEEMERTLLEANLEGLHHCPGRTDGKAQENT